MGPADWSWYLTGGLPRVVRSGNFIFGVELASDLSRVLETIRIWCDVQLLSKVPVDEERLCQDPVPAYDTKISNERKASHPDYIAVTGRKRAGTS